MKNGVRFCARGWRGWTRRRETIDCWLARHPATSGGGLEETGHYIKCDWLKCGYGFLFDEMGEVEAKFEEVDEGEADEEDVGDSVCVTEECVK
ncbi:hypothetical protein KS4_33990 [Poriferisphaera corsica]|uniref:Uncharacterized protein n=1 Tax=Poriferisphaera corsica TaxID=2528020 RepID=A0A517YYM1_9BACT|nr:hypothetical protein KS4_33990 [Poriferisphaera corsica]